MKLKYNGNVEGYTASMSFLEAGPYDFSNGTCEVEDNDAKILMERSPMTFLVSVATEDKYSCPECEKTYKRKGDLDNHMQSQHPEITKK